MSIRLRLKILISILFITAIGNTGFTFVIEVLSEKRLNWVNHTHNVIIESERFLSTLKGIESGQRGFLLTDNPSYLQPYYAGLIDSESHFKHLTNLTKDNPEQQQRLETLHKHLEVKFTELAQTIEIARGENGHSKALEIVRSNAGQQSMDNLRSVLNAFISSEYILLEARKGDYRESKATINTLMIVELLFFISLALVTFSFLVKSLFQPLDQLLSSTKKTEDGKSIDVIDIVPNDEMGYLLSRFFTMNQKIQKRAKNLSYKANHDELTGLKNRTILIDEVDEAIETSQRNNTKSAAFYIDLNDFKILNDTLGHEAGDAMLVETAERIKSAVRKEDVVFRVGGDEFVVLIKDVHNVKEVSRIASKLLTDISPPVMISGERKEIKLSVGIAVSPDDSQNSEEMLKFADIAMYEAKQDKTSSNFKFFKKVMAKRALDRKD